MSLTGSMIDCSDCGTAVLLNDDGSCPSCGHKQGKSTAKRGSSKAGKDRAGPSKRALRRLNLGLQDLENRRDKGVELVHKIHLIGTILVVINVIAAAIGVVFAFKFQQPYPGVALGVSALIGAALLWVVFRFIEWQLRASLDSCLLQSMAVEQLAKRG